MAAAAQQPTGQPSRSMRAGDIWAGPSRARWLVFQIGSDGMAHLRRVCTAQTRGRKYLCRSPLAPSTWILVERSD
jgi:hypothetical protein